MAVPVAEAPTQPPKRMGLPNQTVHIGSGYVSDLHSGMAFPPINFDDVSTVWINLGIASHRIASDVVVKGGQSDTSFVHRHTEDIDIDFVSNNTGDAIHLPVEFRVRGS